LQEGPRSIAFKDSKGDFTLFSAYFWLIAALVTLFILWTLPVKNCLGFVRHWCCRNQVFSSLNANRDEDFYECINFTSLKEKLVQTQDALEKARMVRASGRHKVPNIDEYIKTLQQRRQDIVAQINRIAERVLGKDRLRGYTTIHEKLAKLNKEDQEHPIGGGKIRSELQSYDLLQNEKYNRLQELKMVLEDVRCAT